MYKTEELALKDRTIPVLDDRAEAACRDVIEHFGEVSCEAPKGKRAATTQATQDQKLKVPKLSPVGDLEIDILSAVRAGQVSRWLFIFIALQCGDLNLKFPVFIFRILV